VEGRGHLVIGAIFVRRQQRAAHPLVDVRLFRSAGFSSAIGALLAAVFVIDGTFLFAPHHPAARAPHRRSPKPAQSLAARSGSPFSAA